MTTTSKKYHVSIPPLSKNGFFLSNDEFYVEIDGHHKHTRCDPSLLYYYLTYQPPAGPALTKSGEVAKRQPTPHTDPPVHFYRAQLAHYGLKSLKTKEPAKKALLAAYQGGEGASFNGKVQLVVPERILALEREMREEYRVALERAEKEYAEQKKRDGKEKKSKDKENEKAKTTIQAQPRAVGKSPSLNKNEMAAGSSAGVKRKRDLTDYGFGVVGGTRVTGMATATGAQTTQNQVQAGPSKKKQRVGDSSTPVPAVLPTVVRDAVDLTRSDNGSRDKPKKEVMEHTGVMEGKKKAQPAAEPAPFPAAARDRDTLEVDKWGEEQRAKPADVTQPTAASGSASQTRVQAPSEPQSQVPKRAVGAMTQVQTQARAPDPPVQIKRYPRTKQTARKTTGRAPTDSAEEQDSDSDDGGAFGHFQGSYASSLVGEPTHARAGTRQIARKGLGGPPPRRQLAAKSSARSSSMRSEESGSGPAQGRAQGGLNKPLPQWSMEELEKGLKKVPVSRLRDVVAKFMRASEEFADEIRCEIGMRIWPEKRREEFMLNSKGEDEGEDQEAPSLSQVPTKMDIQGVYEITVPSVEKEWPEYCEEELTLTVSVPSVEKEWPEYCEEELTLTVSPSSTQSHLWCSFNFGVFEGVMRSLNPPPRHFHEKWNFQWKCQDAMENIMQFQSNQTGEIVFLGNGKIKGRLFNLAAVGTCEFTGKRTFTGSPNEFIKEVKRWKSDFRGINQGAYEVANVRRWGSSRWMPDATPDPPAHSDTSGSGSSQDEDYSDEFDQLEDP
ncbi:hypothetical protein AX16_010080 [Volvariella volvacea WC 439]|nr:hypothetical protein AX16_010080 [Volvariella volvacea WC 439]